APITGGRVGHMSASIAATGVARTIAPTFDQARATLERSRLRAEY
ncbi:hypothetical protein FJY63_13390, partial [Candidatus Sumerlaeota bacterium]|nr:hypothetical protein [Candidatus Sumerlaeota bacterium]